MTVAPFEYVFPAIKGVQAKREYYTSMCPLRLIPKIFLFDEEELVPELRAQRSLNRNRLPEMSQYILRNPNNYVFSALTASIDSDVHFEPLSALKDEDRIGLLRVPMEARFIINDGQHRRAAIELALRENPQLGNETIAVVFFLDKGLERCQQMFADLNRHAVRPSKSLGVLYDHRDEHAKLVKLMVFKNGVFRDLVEFERTTLSKRSKKLFTLSAIYNATDALLGKGKASFDAQLEQATLFWEQVSRHFVDWGNVRAGKLTSGEIRRDYIHSHGIVLQAIGGAGRALLKECSSGWKRRLARLKKIDWSRSNAELWEGRALVGGRVCKGTQNVILTRNVIKKHLGLELSPEETRVEEAYLRGENG